ncbi:MAG: cupin domain-containing protein [Thiohalophilus sp.]|uniref:ribosomal protein uL16 3-hydroxylase n=1 Tax=Thiohalophilus sp. TaxID=3028392 RepID=UPI0028702AC6|nr:cupin domain-containing protein [Thiohalophilus sp.]MDR9436067.1 cupin domain-containing protein [Thiohalophilus sp.]
MAARAPLGQLSPAGFLQDYWQQQPLLIRQALDPTTFSLSPDELAGLACETDIESRLILEKDGPQPWYLENGPFDAERFASLPDSHWTLLVQDVDKYIPQIAELLHQFRFIPDWRIDDVMISYATNHGSVGPHVDNYDVFLLQTHGRRRWRINTQPVADDNFIPDIALHILKQFDGEQEWLLEPGDMLYLPPGVAHHGIAEGECMTMSVGFRAPSYAQLIGSYADDYVESQQSHRFYTDPGRDLPDHPAHLDSRSLAELRAILRLESIPDTRLNEWLGCFLTEAKQHDAVLPLETPLSPDTIKQTLSQQPVLVRNPWARLIYTQQENQLNLFAAGHLLRLDPTLLDPVRWICDHDVYALDNVTQWQQDTAFIQLLTDLINAGVILIDETD